MLCLITQGEFLVLLPGALDKTIVMKHFCFEETALNVPNSLPFRIFCLTFKAIHVWNNANTIFSNDFKLVMFITTAHHIGKKSSFLKHQ